MVEGATAAMLGVPSTLLDFPLLELSQRWKPELPRHHVAPVLRSRLGGSVEQRSGWFDSGGPLEVGLDVCVRLALHVGGYCWRRAEGHKETPESVALTQPLRGITPEVANPPVIFWTSCRTEFGLITLAVIRSDRTCSGFRVRARLGACLDGAPILRATGS